MDIELYKKNSQIVSRHMENFTREFLNSINYYSEINEDLYLKYINGLKQIAGIWINEVIHVSSICGIAEKLKACHNKTMYGQDAFGVFASSGINEMYLYMCRAVTGPIFEKNGYCLLRSNPFKGKNGNNLILKDKVCLYNIDISNFYPVVNLYVSEENKIINIQFDREWLCPCDVKIKDRMEIGEIPINFLETYKLFIIDDIDLYEKYFQKNEFKFEKLVELGGMGVIKKWCLNQNN